MRTLAIIKYGFTLIGVGLLVATGYLVQDVRGFLAGAVRADGVVVSHSVSRSRRSTAYYPVVAFDAAGGERIEFVSDSGSGSPSPALGAHVEVLHPPGSPRDARLAGFSNLWGGTIIVGVLGTVFAAIGLRMIGASVARARRREHLRVHGTRVEATFQRVEQNRAFKVNGGYPWRVVSQWPDPATGEVHVFLSEDLWFDPTGLLAGRATIPVLIERGDPRRYWVDLSFLPRRAA